MLEMTKRLVMAMAELPFDTAQWARLQAEVEPDELLRVSASDKAAVSDALRRAEVAILPGDLEPRHAAAANLRWIHCDHAGLTKSALPEIFERDLIVTGSAGRSAPALAEHTMLFMMALSSNLIGFHEAQKRHQWRGVDGMQNLRALCGRTIGIIGMGHTGVALAARAKAFEMKTIGYRRRDLPAPPGVDRMLSADRGETLDPMFAEADFIALVVNLSDATHHLIGAAELARMKPGVIIVNMARGGVMDEAALIENLKSGHVAGAGLDVFAEEPLPATSPLWDAPNVLVTPHFTPPVPDRSQRSLETIIENLRRYRAGEKMLNRISREDVYTR
jgi:phosphoglycerate dehydrogenase-like enzyme